MAGGRLERYRKAIRWRMKGWFKKGQNQNESFDRVLAHFIGTAERPVIFDIGAHHGESVRRFRKIFPGCSVHAFEPDLENFAALERNWGGQENVFLNNRGASSLKSKLLFYRNLKSNTSGFHPINTGSAWAQMRSERHNVTPEEFTEKSYEIPVTDLDSYAMEHGIGRIHLLKIDTQGHEDEVLRGCQNLLKEGKIDVIETELIVGDAYVKSLQFYDLEQVLAPCGYRLCATDKGGDRLATPSLSFNAIYIHKRFLDGRTPTDEREAA